MDTSNKPDVRIANLKTRFGQSRSAKRSDFILSPYIKSDNLRATWQIVNTIVPYGVLWILVVHASRVSVWLTSPLLVLMVLFSGRCFGLMHDCSHESLFRSKPLNRVAGFLLGVVNSIPQYPWYRGHAFHHQHNGNWEVYPGPSALVSTETFMAMDVMHQRFYQFLRHPLMLFPGGLFYLVIKPKILLVMGIFHYFVHAIPTWFKDPRQSLAAIHKTYKPKYWYTDLEFQHHLGTNLLVLSIWYIGSQLIGAGLFFTLYSITLACSGAMIICVFFVQHNFEGASAKGTEGWNSMEATIDGTSQLKLPLLLNWFTANVAYHNIHHLSSRIPNYHLRACYSRNSSLLNEATILTLYDIPQCFKLILWDRANERLVSVAEAISTWNGGTGSLPVASDLQLSASGTLKA